MASGGKLNKATANLSESGRLRRCNYGCNSTKLENPPLHKAKLESKAAYASISYSDGR